ncbi:DUF167 domain-containing protein [Neorhizobium galegae]|uniref:DUF167 domain-containing protein n=1 Tax=Neorhizobium galegae TaxID=399 RepID=UPI0006223134|nr:DUF167 domain-containing protein [Neorhizobium galegae]MCQ1807051.1 DUF167 domain-containing protein [Neorhizobium galegae]CDZ59749.1 UPF0235 protein [Neorhizobium galegae bv. orientalis]
MSGAYSRHSDHLRLAIRLTPNSGRNAVEGIETAADGEVFLKARVTAVPEDGKANKALILLLADTFRLPKSSISILSGETARKKILRIDGDPEDLEEKFKKVLKA